MCNEERVNESTTVLIGETVRLSLTPGIVNGVEVRGEVERLDDGDRIKSDSIEESRSLSRTIDTETWEVYRGEVTTVLDFPGNEGKISKGCLR